MYSCIFIKHPRILLKECSPEIGGNLWDSPKVNPETPEIIGYNLKRAREMCEKNKRAEKREIQRTPEEQRKIDEFKKVSVQQYKTELLRLIIEHPMIVSGEGVRESPLIDMRKKLNELNAPWLDWYEAVLTTVENIVKSPVFRSNTWAIKKIFANEEKELRMEVYERYISDILNTAAESKTAQNMVWFDNTSFENLSLRDQRKLLNNPPDELYDDFIKALQGASKTSELTKNNVEEYLSQTLSRISEIINKLGTGDPLRKVYENKITQMYALANNDILYDSWPAFKWFFTGNSIDRFLQESEKWKWKNGSIGLDKETGKFQFYTLNEMETEIMKTWEITGSCDMAWDNYIAGTKGVYTKLNAAFETHHLAALALYFDLYFKKNGKESTLIDKNEWFKEHIIKYLPKDYLINNIPLLKNLEEYTIEKDFWNLQRVIQEKWLKTPEKLPIQNGCIDGIALIFAIAGENPTPGTIDTIKQAMDLDFENIKRWASNDKTKAMEGLGNHKDWTSVLDHLNIDNSLHITWWIDGTLGTDQREQLIQKLKWKSIELNQDPKINAEKITLINTLLEILHAEKTENQANVSQNAVQQAATKNIVTAAWDPWKQEALSILSNTTATASVEKKNLENFSFKNEEVIKNFSEKYQLPNNPTTLAHPQYLNTINSITADLSKKEFITSDERIFLDYLVRTREQIWHDAKSVTVYAEIRKSHPEFSETLSNIRDNNPTILNNLTPETINTCKYIDTYINPANPISDITLDLAKERPGTEISLGKYYSDCNIWNGLTSAISLKDCSYTKGKDNESGTINFPPSMGIEPMTWVPVKWIESCLSEADIFVRFWFQSLIPNMQYINDIVTEKFWKITNSHDGSFDPYELSRISTILCSLIGIELKWGETIPNITRTILARYPNKVDISKQLKESNILTEEWKIREHEFESRVQDMKI